MPQDNILSQQQIARIIRRMAYEIYESNASEKAIVIAGISGEGLSLAKMLEEELKNISDLEIIPIEISLDKEKPHKSEINLIGEVQKIGQKPIVVVDDVLNTGRTLIYSLRPFLDNKTKKIEVAVLVDRSYNNFPVKARYIGIELSTTLNDHISVSLGDKKEVILD